MADDNDSEPAVPDPSPFEREIAQEATHVIAQAKTGYNWSSVDAFLTAEGPVLATRCKKASGSGRAANVLTESNDKIVDPYLIFCLQPYGLEQFVSVAKDRIGRFRNVRAVAIADMTTGNWWVPGFVYRDDIDFADQVMTAFPAIKSDWTLEVTGPSIGVTEDEPAVASLDEDVFSEYWREIEHLLTESRRDGASYLVVSQAEITDNPGSCSPLAGYDLRSVSCTHRPDVVVVRGKPGEAPRVRVYDAKKRRSEMDASAVSEAAGEYLWVIRQGPANIAALDRAVVVAADGGAAMFDTELSRTEAIALRPDMDTDTALAMVVF